ncbi:PH domain-like protein [Rozella allomycis CSF55]|uniref:PH domain-like protein n=1 Tax=Rozella allomycis (strain CSF55) TaxID=988480 RepID=A0A4P9YEV2_ROZAC|nr:PH domain-like protein [Rozella allomycis CSF55]
MKSTKEIKEKALQINMKVLKRYDDEAAEIIDMSSHVVLYQFDEDASTWYKKDIEGSLFVYRRVTFPYYGFFIMNRLNITNFKGTFSSQIDLQLTDAYIIFRSQNGM